MKKILFMAMALFAGATASYAQFGTPVDHSVEFVDLNGKVIEDGSIINTSEVEDMEGLLQIKTPMRARNTTDAPVCAGILVDGSNNKLGGYFQICYPNYQCFSSEYAGTKFEQVGDNANPSTVLPGQDFELQSEYFPEEGEYGTYTISYQWKVYNLKEVDKGDNKIEYEMSLKGDGPKVTVNYIYSNPNGINSNVASKQLKSIAYFDLSGREVKNPVQGVFVKKLVYADGTTRTVKEYKK